MDFIAVDFETPNTRHNSICSAGITLVRNSDIIWTRSFLINPNDEFDSRNIAVHGITSSEVSSSPSFSDVWNEVGYLFKHYAVVMHNAPFDFSVLKKTSNRESVSLPAMDIFCTMCLWQENFPDFQHYSLNAIADHLNIPLNHHDAASDSLATAKIMLFLLNDEQYSIHTRINTESHQYSENPIRSNVDSTESNGDNSIRDDSIWRTIGGSGDMVQPELPYYSGPICVAGNKFGLTGSHPQITRTEIINYIENNGGSYSNSISRKTRYLIVGSEDKAIVKNTEGKSGKIKKTEELLSQGADIKYININDFVNLMLHPSVADTAEAVLDSRFTFPQTHEDVCQAFSAFIFEGEKDDDVFTHNETKAGITYSFYGMKVFELITNEGNQTKLRLPDDIMLELFPHQKGLKEGQFYTVSQLFPEELEKLYELLKKKKRFIFRNTITDTFACCNSFMQCSDAKQCIHQDDRFYNGCYYRKNLEAGKVFYGKNRNID